MERALERRMQQVDGLARRLTHPGEHIANQLRELGHLASRLRGAWAHRAAGQPMAIARSRRAVARGASRFRRARHSAARARAAARPARPAHRVDTLAASVKSLAAQLAQLNPRAVFERGYSMVETADGKIVRASSELQTDEEVRLTFARGWARAQVKDKGRES